MANLNPIVGNDGGNALQGSDGGDLIYGFDPDGPQSSVGVIAAVRVASGLSVPLFAAAPDGDDKRLFLVEKTGAIKILDLATGEILATPFLDLTTESDDAGEGGVLGLAFDPDFADNGRFYVSLTNNSGDSEIRRYNVSDDPNLADAGSGSIVIGIAQPDGVTNHKGGWIGFGPDGFLYAAYGDGGGGGDPFGNGQNIDTLLAAMLRLDVDGDAFPSDPSRNYAVPSDNPFVGVAGADEIWAFGLRNPWRPSFDRALGDLFIADVGQNRFEEINRGQRGANYGWSIFEGPERFSEGTPTGGSAVDPIHFYGRDIGGSVTGGYVYRGPSEGLQGQYFFADFSTGVIFTLRLVNGVWTATDSTGIVDTAAGEEINNPTSFGEDALGNLYIVDIDGDVFRLTPQFVSADLGDNIAGLAGDDTLFGGGGNDLLNGGEGMDTAVYSGALAAYAVWSFDGTTIVLSAGADGKDQLREVEALRFADSILATNEVPTFRALDYIASYGDLIEAFGLDPARGFTHYFVHGFGEGRAADAFRGYEYLATYDDLVLGIGDDEADAARHFVQFGFGENRLRDGFDENQYLATYDDLLVAIGGDKPAAARHFVQFGFAEHRVRDGFDENQYLASYDDLILAIGGDKPAAARHFVQFGFAEHRVRDGFDGYQYLATYGDLIVGLGADEAAAARHFVDFGFAEHRIRDGFDAAQYLENYTDLSNAFGDDEFAATVHFIRHGFSEGRTDDVLIG